MADGLSIFIMTGLANEPCKLYKNSLSIEVWHDKNTIDMVLWSMDASLGKLQDACLLTVCGRDGIRFPSGDWITFKNTSGFDNIKRFSKNLNLCNKSLEIESDDMNRLVDRRFLILAMEEKKQSCKKARMNIMEGKTVSRIDLQEFIPTTPGIHPVYFIRNGTLYSTVGHYENATINSRLYKGVIGELNNHVPINDTLFGKPNKLGLREGPNGLFMVGDKIIYKDLDRDDDLNDLMADLHLHSKKYNMTTNVETYSKSEQEVLNLPEHKENNGEKEGNGSFPFDIKLPDIRFMSWLKYVFWVLIGCAILVGIGLLLKFMNLLTPLLGFIIKTLNRIISCQDCRSMVNSSNIQSYRGRNKPSAPYKVQFVDD